MKEKFYVHYDFGPHYERYCGLEEFETEKEARARMEELKRNNDYTSKYVSLIRGVELDKE